MYAINDLIEHLDVREAVSRSNYDFQNKIITLTMEECDYDLFKPLQSKLELRSYNYALKFVETKDGITKVGYMFEMKNDLSVDITIGMEKKYGVVAPDGKFYSCHYEGHGDLEFLLNQCGIIDEPKKHRNSFSESGWLKLSFGYIIDCEWEFDWRVDGEHIKVTEEQYKTMRSYIHSLGRKFTMFCGEWYNVDDLKILPKLNKNNWLKELTALPSVIVENPRAELEKHI